MLWRGLVPEAEVPGGLDGHGQNLEIHGAPGVELVIYGIPGPDGRTDLGHRRISYAWYDASRTELLRQTGCLRGDTVVASLANDQLPAELTDALARLAGRYWPAPWDRCNGWGITLSAASSAIFISNERWFHNLVTAARDSRRVGVGGV